MAFVRVASLSAFPSGSLVEVVLGDDSFALCNYKGELHALSGICPHAGAPLGQGMLEDNLIVCPFHSWAYDCSTGEHDYDRSIKLDRFAVKVDGDDILIDPDTHA